MTIADGWGSIDKPATDALPSWHDVLDACLALTVPMHIEALRDKPLAEVYALGRDCAAITAQHGDALNYHSSTGLVLSAAANALAIGLACAAVASEGGVAFRGMHWCTRQHDGCEQERAA